MMDYTRALGVAKIRTARGRVFTRKLHPRYASCTKCHTPIVVSYVQLPFPRLTGIRIQLVDALPQPDGIHNIHHITCRSILNPPPYTVDELQTPL